MFQLLLVFTLLNHQITSAITGFITKIKENIGDVTFLHQIARIGLLMEFESLISCHGDEMGMLEDMDIAIKDLVNVRCRIEKLTSKTTDAVSISGSRLLFFSELNDINNLIAYIM